MMLQVDKDLQEIASQPPQGRRLRIAGLIALAVAVAATATGLLVRWRHEAAVKHWTITEAVPTVSFVIPRPDSEASRLILPGDIQAWFDAPIYARVNGFLKNWYFDYGAYVKAGQVLAE
jgi:multidrug efflux pump subunit AcrA (membrane-fusion protein)